MSSDAGCLWEVEGVAVPAHVVVWREPSNEYSRDMMPDYSISKLWESKKKCKKWWSFHMRVWVVPSRNEPKIDSSMLFTANSTRCCTKCCMRHGSQWLLRMVWQTNFRLNVSLCPTIPWSVLLSHTNSTLWESKNCKKSWFFVYYFSNVWMETMGP